MKFLSNANHENFVNYEQGRWSGGAVDYFESGFGILTLKRILRLSFASVVMKFVQSEETSQIMPNHPYTLVKAEHFFFCEKGTIDDIWKLRKLWNLYVDSSDWFIYSVSCKATTQSWFCIQFLRGPSSTALPSRTKNVFYYFFATGPNDAYRSPDALSFI